MATVEVPVWWLWASGIFFIVSVVWSIALGVAVVVITRRVVPLISDTQAQIRQVSEQVRVVSAKVSNTADIVHAQTQNLLGNANSAGGMVTRQARTVGTAVTLVLVAARVMNFVRRMM